jgi:hypothetical protein
MKRITYVWLAGSMLTLVSFSNAQSGSLGDYARAARKENKPVANRKFDNDNLPTTEKLSVVGPAAQDDTPLQAAENGGTQSQDAAAPAQTASADNGADKKQPDQWKGKIDEQKSKVDLLSRELDVAQREYRLRSAVMYADAGNRLRNSAAWDKEDAQFKKDIADKQKAVDDAKKGLDNIQEQARKAGIPSSQRQ